MNHIGWMASHSAEEKEGWHMGGNHAKQQGQTSVWLPGSPEEALALKRRFGKQSAYIGGGTWLRTRWEAETERQPPNLIRLDRIAELKRLAFGEDGTVLGAAVSLAELLEVPQLRQRYAALALAAENIAAPSIRWLATIGGNVMTGTGDLLPALLAEEAQAIVFGSNGRTEMPLAEAASGMEDGDLLLGVRLPATEPLEQAELSAAPCIRLVKFFQKVGRREAFIPSLVTIAGTVGFDGAGRLQGIRLAAGGGSAVPCRFHSVEAELAGCEVTADLLKRLHGLIAEQAPAAEDIFAGADYRRLTAANLICAELYGAARGMEQPGKEAGPCC